MEEHADMVWGIINRCVLRRDGPRPHHSLWSTLPLEACSNRLTRAVFREFGEYHVEWEVAWQGEDSRIIATEEMQHACCSVGRPPPTIDRPSGLGTANATTQLPTSLLLRGDLRRLAWCRRFLIGSGRCLRFRLPERGEDVEQCSDADGAVGDVERGPVIAVPIEVQKIDHLVLDDAIDQIPKDATENQSYGNLLQRLADREGTAEDEHYDDCYDRQDDQRLVLPGKQPPGGARVADVGDV